MKGRMPLQAGMALLALAAWPYLATGPLWLIAVLALAYGMSGYADTGTINTATVAAAEPDVRGATMAVHAAVGFTGGSLGSLDRGGEVR